MSQKVYFIRLVLLFFILLLLFFQLTSWQISWVGLMLLAGYFFLTGFWWQEFFHRLYWMRQYDWITRLFGWWAVFLLLGLVSSIAVVWYRLTPTVVWAVYLVAAAITWLSDIWSSDVNGIKPRESLYLSSAQSTDQPVGKFRLWRRSPLLVALYILLWTAGLYFLLISKSTAVLLSPWQTINKYYLPMFFLLTLILGLLLVSKYRVKFLLSLILAHSLLLHLYLPLSHELPWGGDVWRHLGVEQKLLKGEFYPPVLFGPEVKRRAVGGFEVPEAWLIPNKYLYGQLWGTTVLVAATVRADLVLINKWLIPLVWSALLPLLFFRLGGVIFGSWRRGLWLAALAAMAFPLQALGALTLPVSLGYLTFFFVLLLWLQYLRTGGAGQRALAILFAVLMVFGYTLHFILIWLVIGGTYILKKLGGGQGSRVFSFFGMIMFMIAAAGLLPFIEVISHVSQLPDRWDWFGQFRQLLGQFSGWFYASAIRPHDILSGNVIFNHTPAAAYVSNVFTDWRWPVIPIMILIWSLALYRLWHSQRGERQLPWRVLGWLFVTVLGGYLISWFILTGERSLARRLDPALSFLLLVFFLDGLDRLSVIARYLFRDRWLKASAALAFALLLILSWFTTATYASGPDLRVVGQAEYDVAEYILEAEREAGSKHCVLADTWVLLALEGISGRGIVDGGFFIDQPLVQSERWRLYNQIRQAPSPEILVRAYEKSRADRCWIVLPQAGLTPQLEDKLSSFLGGEGQAVGDMVLWLGQRSKTPSVESGDGT